MLQFCWLIWAPLSQSMCTLSFCINPWRYQIYFKWRKRLFWRKYKSQWRLSLHHSSVISVSAWTEKKTKKRVVICKSHEKKLNIFTLQRTLQKRSERNRLSVVERWMQYLLFWLKSQSAREASHHLTLMSNCLPISHTC